MATAVLISIVGFAVGAMLLALFVYRQRKRLHQERLDGAFERARLVQHNGNGVQGKPYSLYGDSSWTDLGKRDR